MLPPAWYIKPEGEYKYLMDDSGNKEIWQPDDDYVSLVDGQEHKKGWLRHDGKNWYEVRWHNSVVVDIQKQKEQSKIKRGGLS
jgi:hypothetical protein